MSFIAGYFNIQMGAISFNPADATTYYTGMPIVNNSGFAQGTGKVFIPKNATLIGYTLTVYTNGTLATTEASTLSVRINNTTDVALDAVMNLSTLVYQSNSSALSTNLTAGDYIELKWLTPTWTTNPTTVAFSVNLQLITR